MAIRRKKQKRNYVEIPNKTIQDCTLSWEARGLLAFMLSKPEDFKIMPSYLMKCGNAGRDKIYKLLNELECSGYLLKEQGRSDGKYGKSDYVVYDEKQTASNIKALRPCPENTFSDKSVESPFPEMPDTVKPYPANQPTNKDRVKKEQSSNKTTTTGEHSFETFASVLLSMIQRMLEEGGWVPVGQPVPKASWLKAKAETLFNKFSDPSPEDCAVIILKDWSSLITGKQAIGRQSETALG